MYNNHIDADNYYREWLMCYVPYRVDANAFKRMIFELGECIFLILENHKV